MLVKATTIVTCLLGVASAIPFGPQLRSRQLQPKYPANGTLTDPPPVTALTQKNPTYTQEQLNKVKLALTMIERLAIIQSFGKTQDEVFKFDLTPNGSDSNAANGLGGQGYLAEVSNYPVIMNTGISVAIGYLNPCGLDSIHLHNRATELVTLVKGQSLKTGFVLEDGFDLPVYTEIGLYQTTIRPQGSLHWEFNDHCESAVFVASLGNEDPGVSRTAQNFFINPQDVLEADMAYPSWFSKVNTTDYRALLPAAFAQGAKSCYKRCGLKYNTNDAGGISK